MREGPVSILLQTTIPPTGDDWSIGRFSRLGALLSAAKSPSGEQMYDVTMRDRDPTGMPDSVLSKLDQSDYDELWLFAVDVGDGLTDSDCEAISRFRRLGRGLLVTRDHMDLGSSICGLVGVGKAHHFHTRNVDPILDNRRIDDPFSTNISWPNYHSGANGDYQIVQPVLPLHPVLTDPDAPEGHLQFLPTHPHEGAIAAPEGEHAKSHRKRKKPNIRTRVQFGRCIRGVERIRSRDRPKHISSFCRLQLGYVFRLSELRRRTAGRFPRQDAGGRRLELIATC